MCQWLITSTSGTKSATAESVQHSQLSHDHGRTKLPSTLGRFDADANLINLIVRRANETAGSTMVRPFRGLPR